MRPWLRLLLLLTSLFMLLAYVPEAQAQSVTINDQGFRIRREDDRGTDQEPDSVSRQDCLDDDPSEEDYDYEDDTGSRTYLEFAVEYSGLERNHVLEIWASRNADCTDEDERQAGGSCRIVFRSSSRLTGFIYTAKVYPRVIITRTNVTDYSPDDIDGSGDDLLPYPEEEVCNSRIDEQYSFYVMLRDGDLIDASDVWEGTRVDTAAPLPPDSLTANPGESNIFLEWDVPVENEEPDADGFAFYCVPSDASAPTPDGGAGAGNAECPQSILVEGELPSNEAESSARCGRVRGQTTREGQASGLENNVLYAVAVASRDIIDNRGELSEIQCATPAEVTTFFERYKDAGGRGGGGFCGLSSQARIHTFWLLALAALVLNVRRRGRRS